MKKIILFLITLCIYTHISAQEEELKSRIMGLWGYAKGTPAGFFKGESTYFFRENELVLYDSFDPFVDHLSYERIYEIEDTIFLKVRRIASESLEFKILPLSDSVLFFFKTNNYFDGHNYNLGYLYRKKDKLNEYSRMLEFYKYISPETFPREIRNIYLEEYETLYSLPPSLKGNWIPLKNIDSSKISSNILIHDQFLDLGGGHWKMNEIFQYTEPTTRRKYYFLMVETYESGNLACLILSPHQDQLSYKLIYSQDLNEPRSSERVEKWTVLQKINYQPLDLKEICNNLKGRYYLDLGKNSIEILGENTVLIEAQYWKMLYIQKGDFLPEYKSRTNSDMFLIHLIRSEDGHEYMSKFYLEHHGGETILYANRGRSVMVDGMFRPLYGKYFKRTHFAPQVLKTLIIYSLVLLAFIIIFYRSVLLPRRLQHHLTRTRLQGVKAQLNPHFLFNSMASIQSLMNQHRIEDANRYLAELSDLLRYHLDEGSDDLVLLSEELDAIQHYCKLEALRSTFDLEIEIQEDIHLENLEIPGQLLQPLVENAIKHGLRNTIAPQLNIQITRNDHHLMIVIEDNGPGIHKKTLIASRNSRKTHQGISLVEEKIRLLKKQGLYVAFEMNDLNNELNQDRHGTQVKLVFPLLIS